MVYFFLGEDNHAKDKKISELKGKYLPSKDARNIDYEIYYGHKLDCDLLKQALIALPAIAPKRFVVIHAIEKLSPQNQQIVLDFITLEQDHCLLILDTFSTEIKNKFFKTIQSHAQVVRFQSKPKQSVFDMTNAMTRRQPAEALKILNDLISQGDHPLPIMGTLVWYWGKRKGRMPSERFDKGLKELQNTDLNIKRSRLLPEYALEVCVLKLCSLGS